jgi:hypothetical protein
MPWPIPRSGWWVLHIAFNFALKDKRDWHIGCFARGKKESKRLIDWRKGFQKAHKSKTSFSSPSLFLSSSKHKN